MNKLSQIENKKILINNKYKNNDILKYLNNYELDNIDYVKYFNKFDELTNKERLEIKKLIVKYYFKNFIYIDNIL